MIILQASNKPLIAASAAGYEAMVKLLLDKNADINVTDLVRVESIAQTLQHPSQIVTYVNDYNPYLTQELCTPLLRACQNKHVSVAKRLCQSNYVDVNAPNKVSPLFG